MKEGQSFEAYMLRLADCLPVSERVKYQWAYAQVLLSNGSGK